MSSGSKYTKDEKELLVRYSKEYYRAINRCLKAVVGEIGGELQFHSDCEKYDHMFDRNYIKLNRDIKTLDRIFKKAPTGYSALLYRGHHAREYDTGKPEPKFISTSKSKEESIPFGKYLYEITVEPDIQYIDMESVSNTKGENEILLPRGLYFHLIEIDKSKSINVYRVVASNNPIHPKDRKKPKKSSSPSKSRVSPKKDEIKKAIEEAIVEFNEDAYVLESESFDKTKSDHLSEIQLRRTILKDIPLKTLKTYVGSRKKKGKHHKPRKSRKYKKGRS